MGRLWVEEIPGVICQEATKPELIETLRVTLREAVDFNRREALEAAGAKLSLVSDSIEANRATY